MNTLDKIYKLAYRNEENELIVKMNNIIEILDNNFLETIRIELKKLKLNGKEIIVLKMAKPIGENMAEKIRYMLDKKGFEDVGLILMNDDIKIEVLDEKMMFKIGWMRKEKIEMIIDEKIDSESGLIKVFKNKECKIEVDNDKKIVIINDMKYSMKIFNAFAVGGLKINTPFVFVKREDGVITIKDNSSIITNN